MVVPAGGVRLTVHLLFLFLLAAKPTLVSMAVTSLWTSDHHGLSSTGNVSDDTIHPEQADMPLQEQFYRGQGMALESGHTGADSMLADEVPQGQDRFQIGRCPCPLPQLPLPTLPQKRSLISAHPSTLQL